MNYYYCRFRRLFAICSLWVLASGWGSGPCIAGDVVVDGIIRAATIVSCDSINRIGNFTCTTRVYERFDEPGFEWTPENVLKVLELSKEGYPLVGEYVICHDRDNRRMKYSVRELSVPKGDEKAYWVEFTAVFDGDKYRVLNPERNSGLQVLYRDELAPRKSVHTLLGDGIGGGAVAGANLTSWLSQPEGWGLESPVDAVDPTIVRTFRTDAVGTDMLLRVTLSSRHGFLPRLIETFWCDTNSMCARVTSEEFLKVESIDGWVPVRGKCESFYRDAILPTGITLEDYKKLSHDEKRRVDPFVTYQAIPLSSPGIIVVDEGTLKINVAFSGDDFFLKFPEDARIFDEIAGEVLLGGKHRIAANRKGNAVSASKTVLWPWLAAINGLVLLLLYAFSRLRRSR